MCVCVCARACMGVGVWVRGFYKCVVSDIPDIVTPLAPDLQAYEVGMIAGLCGTREHTYATVEMHADRQDRERETISYAMQCGVYPMGYHSGIEQILQHPTHLFEHVIQHLCVLAFVEVGEDHEIPFES